MNNMLSFAVGPGRKYIRVTGSGLWTADQAETHFHKLGIALRKMRAELGRALVLVDLREALVQPAATTVAMTRETARIYEVRDRVAVVCATALLAMQIKRVAAVYDLATFTDCDAALAWLCMRDPQGPDQQDRKRIPAAS